MNASTTRRHLRARRCALLQVCTKAAYAQLLRKSIFGRLATLLHVSERLLQQLDRQHWKVSEHLLGPSEHFFVKSTCSVKRARRNDLSAISANIESENLGLLVVERIIPEHLDCAVSELVDIRTAVISMPSTPSSGHTSGFCDHRRRRIGLLTHPVCSFGILVKHYYVVSSPLNVTGSQTHVVLWPQLRHISNRLRSWLVLPVVKDWPLAALPDRLKHLLWIIRTLQSHRAEAQLD